jgi:hypothetical protein
VKPSKGGSENLEMRTWVAIIGFPLFFALLVLNWACKLVIGIDCFQSLEFDELADIVFWCGIVTLCYFVAVSLFSLMMG